MINKTSRKVLILSYFFPPSNLAGSYRIYSWAKYLNDFGYYPVIITRNWENKISTFKDMSKPTTTEIIHKKNEQYEVFYLPYKGNLRDRIFFRYGEKRFVLVRRILSFFEVFLQNYFISVIPFKNIYFFSREYLKNNPDITLIIASGKPYILFQFGFLLNKEFGTNWVADYRDEWTTHQWYRGYTVFRRILNTFETFHEKKWVGSSSFITSVSEIWSKRISELVNRPGYEIMNGFDVEDYKSSQKYPLFEEFSLTYNGTLYHSQPCEIFLNAFKKTIEHYKSKIKIRLYFVGLSLDRERSDKVRKMLKGYEDNYIITERVPKEEVIRIQKSSHVLLMIGHVGVKGWHSSKIFEYLAFNKPIILCPSDHDVLDDLIRKTKSGYICINENETYEILLKLIEEFYSTGKLATEFNSSCINQYTRKNQALKFAELLDYMFQVTDIPANTLIKTDEKNVRNSIFKTIYYLNIDKVLYKMNSVRDNITVLCFHSISDETNIAYPPLKVKDFSDILLYINKHYKVIRFSEINEKNVSKKQRLILTFDDGYKDFIDNALPLLVKNKLPAVINMIVECAETGYPIWTQRLNNILNYIYLLKNDFIFRHQDIEIKFEKKDHFQNFNQRMLKYLLGFGKKERNFIIAGLESQFHDYSDKNINMMNWGDLQECIENNIEIGSHSLTHDSLLSINNNNILRDEIELSKQIIEKRLRIKINTFAFPNGLYNKEIVDICKHAGYRFLLTTNEKFLKTTSFIQDKNILIPRISVNKKSYYENIFKIHNFHRFYY